ncbi:hypothetical protein FUB37_00885 [Campylobacter jejuni]|nr:hypothetical protein [Campylobacter jejuni]ECP5951161.1 hypothetical protein [Campylobacter jejuni]
MKLSDFDFRIWDGKKYINNIKGGVYIHKINDHIKCLNRSQDCYDYEFELDDLDNSNLEIELFTGFYDKNGKKIYEGDILENKMTMEDLPYKVVFKWGVFYLVEIDGNDEDLMSEFLFMELEVIGNIHENAELLK